MKRWTVRIVVFLPLGAIANIAVAWSISLWAPRLSIVEHEELESETAHKLFENRYAGALDTKGYEVFGIIVRRTGQAWVFVSADKPVDGGLAAWWTISRFEYGLPLRGLAGEQHVLRRKSGHRVDIRTERGFWIVRAPGRLLGSSRISELSRVPLRPIWFGFAVNTLTYGALLWLVFCGPLALRRQRRARRGNCPSCDYNLRGELDIGCPECGWHREANE